MEVIDILLSSVMFTSSGPNYRVVALPVASPLTSQVSLLYASSAVPLDPLTDVLLVTRYRSWSAEGPSTSFTLWPILMSFMIIIDQAFPLIVFSERYAVCVANILPPEMISSQCDLTLIPSATCQLRDIFSQHTLFSPSRWALFSHQIIVVPVSSSNSSA